MTSLENFDKQLAKLVKELSYIKCTDEKIVNGLKCYTDIYETARTQSLEKSDPQILNRFLNTSKGAFERLLLRSAQEIYNTDNDDRWMKQSVIIKISMNEKASEKFDKYIIYLSDLYLLACDDKFDEEASNKDVVRPDVLKMLLLRIFYYLSENNRAMLERSIVFFENSLKIKDENRTVVLKKKSHAEQFSNIGNMMLQSLKNFGAGDFVPGLDEINLTPKLMTDLYESVLKTDVKSVLTDLGSTLQQGKDLSQVSANSAEKLKTLYSSISSQLNEAGIPAPSSIEDLNNNPLVRNLTQQAQTGIYTPQKLPNVALEN
jgi:hypothetical protein